MSTPYDDAAEIHLEFDGRILRGRYQIWNYPARRELRVYYNGHSEAATIGDDTAEKQLAMELFQRIVSRHYTLMSRIAPALPQAIRQAAFRYVNDIEDDLPNDAAGGKRCREPFSRRAINNRRTKHWTRAAIWSWKMVALTRRGLVNAVVRPKERRLDEDDRIECSARNRCDRRGVVPANTDVR